MFYDLTGENPEYKVADQRHVVFSAGQMIDLRQPAFLDSIVVKAILPEGEASMATPLDWVPGPIDTEATSEALLRDSEFDKTLVSKIQIVKAFTAITPNYVISIEFQKFRSSVIDDAILEGVPEEYDPAIIADLVQTVRYLQSVADSGSIVATPIDEIKILNVDLTGNSEDNFIQDERYDVDTENGKSIIIPIHGSFYTNDLVLKYIDGNGDTVTMVKDEHYAILGADIAKDKISLTLDGVYKYIFIKSGFTGTVLLSYRAFGGDVTPADFAELNRMMLELAHRVATNKYVTTFNLPDHEYIIDIADRIESLEDWRRQLKVPEPSYKFIIPTTEASDPNYRFYKIATMYKDPKLGEGELEDANIQQQGNANFRIKLENSGLVFDIVMSINLKSRNVDMFSVRMLSAIGYTADDARYLQINPVTPIVRCVTKLNDQFELNYGVDISLGLNVPDGETVIVDHLTHANSEIALYDGDIQPAYEADLIPLPGYLDDGTTHPVADVHNLPQDVICDTTVLTPFDGRLIWYGGKILGGDTKKIVLLESNPNLDDILYQATKKVRCVIIDRWYNDIRVVDLPTCVHDIDTIPISSISTQNVVVDMVDGVALNISILNGYEQLALILYQGMCSATSDRFILRSISLIGGE